MSAFLLRGENSEVFGEGEEPEIILSSVGCQGFVIVVVDVE